MGTTEVICTAEEYEQITGQRLPSDKLLDGQCRLLALLALERKQGKIPLPKKWRKSIIKSV